MGIKIVKEIKRTDYTSVDDFLCLELRQVQKKDPDVKQDKTIRDFRLRDDARVNKLKHKSKVSGGHGMQGHSPVYE